MNKQLSDKRPTATTQHSNVHSADDEALRKAQEESEQRRRLYEVVTSNTPDLIYVFDLDYKVTFANEALLEMWGKTWSQAIGRRLLELGYEPWHAEMHEREIDEVVATKKAIRGEVSFPHATLGPRIYDYIFSPVIDAQGNVTAVAGTTRDITDIKQAEEDRRQQHETEQRMQLLTEQHNALLKLNKAKDEFVALASHQLRTPATAVKQYIGLLLGDFVEPLTEKQREFLQVAYDSNERELSIINDLLKTAQIDNIEYKLTMERCDIIGLIKEAVDELQAMFEQRQQKVSLLCAIEELELLVDPTEIKLAVVNLLENASKYSRASEIKVKIKQSKHFVDIAFIDKGVGIHKDDQTRIFEKFTRVENELSDTVMGTGLGLHWVKQIIEMHHGRVTLRSEPHKGSTFTIRLPL